MAEPPMLLPPPERSDGALAAAIAGSDPDALAEVYDRHGVAVYAFAHCLLREQRHAEAVTRELFLALWRAPSDFPLTDGSLRVPLLLRAHPVAAALIDDDPRRKRVHADEPATCLAQLPAAEAVAIALVCLDGLTYQDVAALVLRPVQHVAADIRQGLSRLASPK